MKNGIALVVALILGILGFATMYVVMSRPVGAQGGGEQKVVKRVIVAKKDLRSGAKLDAESIDVKEIPVEYSTGVHIDESEKATFLGRPLRMSVAQGEPILKIALELGQAGAAQEIEAHLTGPDRYAISLALDEPGSVAGLIKPNQRVDVIGSFDLKLKEILPQGAKAPSGGGDTISRTVMLAQNRQILAVDVKTERRFEGDPREVTKHVVTLAVTPEEAMAIAALQWKGKAHLVLRNSKDTTKYAVAPFSGAELFGNGKDGR